VWTHIHTGARTQVLEEVFADDDDDDDAASVVSDGGAAPAAV
jgi:hypothetical protein